MKWALLFLMLLEGCGYTMRGKERPFFEEKQIRALYVPPVKNDSYKPGVEILIYNTIRKRFAQWGYIRLVDNEAQSDAVFSATVLNAISESGVAEPADKLTPRDSAPRSVLIASNYNVTLTVKFNLSQKQGSLWSGTITRNKSFQAATYMGTLGTTSALINESQFDDTLGELATSVITDAEESMNVLF